MSGESHPITASVFADAIKELPLSAIYGKVSELRNSVAHLRRSNEELRSFVTESSDPDGDKRELESYIAENGGVIASMEERITLLKTEVENRGQLWIEVEDAADASTEGGQGTSTTVNGTGEGSAAARGTSAGANSGNTNEEREDGVHL